MIITNAFRSISSKSIFNETIFFIGHILAIHIFVEITCLSAC